VLRRYKEHGVGFAPEMMTQHSERAGGVPELLRDFLGRAFVDEESAQSFVLTMLRPLRLQEELLGID